VEERRKGGAYSPDTLAVCLARVGSPSAQRIVCGTLAELCGIDMGPPLHCLVLTGNVHPLEMEFLAQFRHVRGQ
jgi:diphthine synthase